MLFTVYSFSVAAVANLHVADATAREKQYQSGYDYKTRHSDPGRRRQRGHCKRPFVNRHWRQRVEIVDHTDFFQYRWHEKVGPLPKVQYDRGNNRITEEQADNQKECAVTDTSENRDRGIGEQ